MLFITGAGVSAESGIPTYRGIGGLYNVDTTEDGVPIEEALSASMLAENPALTWKYLAQIGLAVQGARHNRAVIGMQLDPEGWLPIDDMIQNANRHGKQLSLELLHDVVASCEKKRFALSEDGLKIRANQGHSVPDVELNLQRIAPPSLLYHGTVAPFVESIRAQGLLKRSRNHVHLSGDIETANKVGARRGKPVILTVLADAMHQSGHAFYRSANGVWLTDAVPVSFIEFPGIMNPANIEGTEAKLKPK